MHSVIPTLSRIAAIALIFSALTACIGKPIDPDAISQVDEIPPGPGLFTGEAGQFEFNF